MREAGPGPAVQVPQQGLRAEGLGFVAWAVIVLTVCPDEGAQSLLHMRTRRSGTVLTV